MGKSSAILKGGKAIVKFVAPDVVNLGAKLGTDFLEMQKNLVRIPDLKDVHVDEAVRVLKDDLGLTATAAIANPNSAYADESEYDVMYSEPRFGSRVNPKTAVKIYYLTQEVIDKSKALLGNQIQAFKVPELVGLDVYEAREDLECLGLRVKEKLEKPDLKFIGKEDGQVTRITYPNDRKIGSKLKTGDRVLLYYVDAEVIRESKAIREKKDSGRQEIIDKIGTVTKGVTKGIYDTAADAPQAIARNLSKPFKKKTSNSNKNED